MTDESNGVVTEEQKKIGNESGWGKFECEHGYGVFEGGFERGKEGILSICTIDEMQVYEDDYAAAKQAKKDGIPILMLPYNQRWMETLSDYTDSPGIIATKENIERLKKICKEEFPKLTNSLNKIIEKQLKEPLMSENSKEYKMKTGKIEKERIQKIEMTNEEKANNKIVTCGNFQKLLQKTLEGNEKNILIAVKTLTDRMQESEKEKFNGICISNGATNKKRFLAFLKEIGNNKKTFEFKKEKTIKNKGYER